MAEITEPMNLSVNGLSDTNLLVTNSKLPDVNTALSSSNDSSNQSPLISPVTSPSLNSRKFSFRSIPRDPAEFLSLALAVRSSNGRIQKALQQAQQRPGVSVEVANMTGADLQGLVKALCALIGCKRLDSSVLPDAVAQAVDTFLLQNQSGIIAGKAEGNTSLSADSMDLNGGTSLSIDPCSSVNPPNTTPVESSTPSGLCIETPPEAPSPGQSHLGTSFSPNQQGGHNGYYNQFAPQQTLSRPQSVRSLAAEVTQPSQSNPNTPRVPLTLDEVYQQFWELAYRLFLYVCNPYRHCHECLCVVEDLVLLLENCSELRSPLPALALDSVIQRAMYELSDKVSRPLDQATLLALQHYHESLQSQAPADGTDGSAAATSSAEGVTNDARSCPSLPTVHAPDCSVRNIEMCIALMSRNVSPICAKIRDDYYTAHGLPAPSVGQNWCEKVLTLTRQLQELIAWSSPHCQARVPAYVPIRRLPQSALAAKDTLFTDRSLTDSNPQPDAPQGTTTGPVVPSEPKVIDFISALSPTTASEVASTLKLKDAALCEVLRQMGAQSMYAKMPHDLESSIQLNLHKVIHQSISSDCSIVLTGAAVLGLSDAHNKVKLDYVALAAPYHANYHDLSLEEQRADVTKYNEIQDSLKELERAVETDKLTEIAWKHLKACARDFHTQSQDYIIKLTSNNTNNNNNNMEQHQYGGRGYNAHNPHNNANMNPYEPYSNHTNHHHQHNKYVLQPPQYNSNFNNNSQYPGSPGNSTLPPELILEIAEDAEKMRKIGDNLVEKYFALRLERTAQAPVVNQILRKMEEVQESNDKNERDRINFVRKFSKSLDRVLKDNRYLYVRMVSNKARFTHINFEQHVSPHVQVSVNVIGCNPLPVQMTELVQDYINLDTTNKVRDFLQTVKLFASSHHISDPASGYLSSTAWYVMALHVLLKHNLLPNLHHTRLFGAQKSKETVTPDTASVALTTTGTTNQSANNNNNTNNTSSMSLSARTLTPRAAYTPHTLPAEYRDRLHSTSLLVMLDLFFRYYVEQMNLFTSVVTLREQGLLLPKTEWPANPVLWRVSIEDPFEAIGSHKPYDLGSTLSRPGQLTTFKALRRAVYGIHSIMADTSNECHENISRLFSRVELINLARRSDYMGAVITASPAWVRPRDVSILDSPQYAAYSTTLCKKYEAPEALQGMFPALVSPREIGNNAGMSPALQQHKVQPGAAPVTTTGGSLSARATEFQPSWMSASGSSAPSSARSAASSIKASPPMHQQGHGQGQYPQQQFQQGYKQGPGYANPAQPVNAAGGSYTYGQAGSGNTASGPLKTPGLHLTQHPQAYHQPSAGGAPQQGRVDPRDPRSRQGFVQGQSPSQGQYREDPQMSYSNQQGPQSQQMPSQRMPYQGGGTVNLNNRQMVPVVPPQQHQQSPPGGAGGAQSGQNAHVHVPRHILLQQKKMQQQAPPFDAAAAALAAAAERRYPVNQIMPSQNFDPKNRAHMQSEQHAQRAPAQAAMLTTGAQPPMHHPQHQLLQKPQQQMPSQPPFDRFAHSSPPSRNDATRAYGMLDERHARQDPLMYQQEERNHGGNLAPRGQEGRYGADSRQMVPQTARQESHRFPMEDAHPSGSMSARYASQEDRYATYGPPQAPLQQPSRQQEQHQQLLQQNAQQQEQLYHQQLQRAAEPAPARQPKGLAAGFKLDLQPRFAEDRYSYAPDSARSASVASSAYPSARNPEDRTMPGPVNIGNLSARRLSELSALNHSPRPGYADNHSMISPRLQLQQAQAQTQPTPLSLSLQSLQAQSSQSQKKSPVVPLIPLEGISNFSGSSGSDYSNSNPLYSDRSSLYLSTGRSDGLADTGRTLVNNNHLANAGYGPPGSSRSTGTQHHLSQYPSHQSSHNNIAGSNAYHQYSAPNTARSMDFALGPDLDSADDYGQDYFSSGLGHHLTARSLEESLQLTDRSPASDFTNPSHGSDSLLTNRLGYMGLDDLRNSSKNELGLPLSVVRPAQASLLPLSGEFDDIFTRLNKNPLSNTQSMSVSQGSGRAGSFVNDLPLNSARSVNSANSVRAGSHASNLGPVDSFDFGGPSNNNNNLFGNNNSMGNMSNRSGNDLHSLYPARVPSITPVDLPGLLGLSGDAEMYAKTAHAAVPGPYAGLYSSPNSSGSTDFSGNSVAGVIPSVDATHSTHLPVTYE